MKIEDYIKTDWQPNIVDPITEEVISEGTRFTSKRANNFEDGIHVNRELHKKVADKIKRLEVELEIIGRVPGGNAFFDVLEKDEELNGLLLDDNQTFAINVVDSTTISVMSTESLKLGEYTIYDDENIGVIDIIEIKDKEVVVKELERQFKKGAIITKNAAETVDGMYFKTFGNYSIKGSVI